MLGFRAGLLLRGVPSALRHRARRTLGAGFNRLGSAENRSLPDTASAAFGVGLAPTRGSPLRDSLPDVDAAGVVRERLERRKNERYNARAAVVAWG